MLKITLIGRIGKDAENAQTKNGTPYARFNVAIDEGTGENKTTRWLTCYKNNAEKLMPYLTKGTLVYIEGQHRATTSEKDGKVFLNEFVNITNLELLGGKNNNNKQEDMSF